MDKELSPPSEEFMAALNFIGFFSTGSIIADCELCGRTHFNDERNNYNEGEFERLQRKNEEEPEKYVFHNDEDSILIGYIDNKQVVYGCECNRLRLYENLFWESRDIISAYFKLRAESQRQEAKRNVGLAKNVSEALESIQR